MEGSQAAAPFTSPRSFLPFVEISGLLGDGFTLTRQAFAPEAGEKKTPCELFEQPQLMEEIKKCIEVSHRECPRGKKGLN